MLESIMKVPPYPIPAVLGSGGEHRKDTKLQPFLHLRVWKSATFPGVKRGGEIGIIQLEILGTSSALAITLNGNRPGSGQVRIRAKQRTARTVR
jgi:hypothetical protein